MSENSLRHEHESVRAPRPTPPFKALAVAKAFILKCTLGRRRWERERESCHCVTITFSYRRSPEYDRGWLGAHGCKIANMHKSWIERRAANPCQKDAWEWCQTFKSFRCTWNTANFDDSVIQMKNLVVVFTWKPQNGDFLCKRFAQFSCKHQHRVDKNHHTSACLSKKCTPESLKK